MLLKINSVSECKFSHSVVFEIQTWDYGKLTPFNKSSIKTVTDSLVLHQIHNLSKMNEKEKNSEEIILHVVFKMSCSASTVYSKYREIF